MKKLNITQEEMKIRQNAQREASRRPNTTCDQCIKPIYRRTSVIKRNAMKFCNHACAILHYGNAQLRTLDSISKRSTKMTGAQNPAWKGGVTIFKKKGNYANIRYLRAPDWALPMARMDGYVMEHRLIMAKLCGFLLQRTECVHHLDHNPLNNSPVNLELWPDNRSHKLSEHGRFIEGAVCRWLPIYEPILIENKSQLANICYARVPYVYRLVSEAEELVTVPPLYGM